jgi:hypothetical protein
MNRGCRTSATCGIGVGPEAVLLSGREMRGAQLFLGAAIALAGLPEPEEARAAHAEPQARATRLISAAIRHTDRCRGQSHRPAP